MPGQARGLSLPLRIAHFHLARKRCSFVLRPSMATPLVFSAFTLATAAPRARPPAGQRRSQATATAVRPVRIATVPAARAAGASLLRSKACGVTFLRGDRVLPQREHRINSTRARCTRVVAALSTSAEIAAFVAEGPLLSKLGLSAAQVEAEADWWQSLGGVVCKHLDMDPSALDEASSKRVYHYYLPVYYWVEKTLNAHKAASGDSPPPLIVGISAPQGCGKTTLVTALEVLFKHRGLTAGTVSIDDFYLCYEDQQALATANPTNGLLRYRGNAGSHDLELGTKTLEAVLAASAAGATVATPRYNKSAYSGRGDRAPEAEWPQLEGPIDVVLFEGWMSGFKPVSTEAAEAVSPELVAVNDALRAYEEAWDRFCNAWLVVKVQDYNWVQKWRLQAEVQMRNAGKPCMTDEQVQDFVNRFLPAYQAYLPGLYADGPAGTTSDTPLLMLEVDESRNVQG